MPPLRCGPSAFRALTAGVKPLVAFKGEDGARRLVVPSWGKWNSAERAGASTARAQRTRQRHGNDAATIVADDSNDAATVDELECNDAATTLQLGLSSLLSSSLSGSGSPSEDPTREAGGVNRSGAPTTTGGRKPAKRKQPETEIPDDWEPDDAAIATGRGLGFDVARVMSEGEKFAARNRAKRTTYVRWGQAFGLWLRNAKDWEAQRTAARGPSRVQPAAPEGKSHWGAQPGDPDF